MNLEEENFAAKEDAEKRILRKKMLIVGVTIVLIFAASFYYYAKTTLLKTEAPALFKEQVINAEENTDTSLNTTNTQKTIVVYVTGGVLNPGLYSLPPKSRVVDLIQAAGGFLPNTDYAKVNLAKVLKDGMQINVPLSSSSVTAGLPSVTGGASTVSGGDINGRININTAGKEELDKLPGIGSDRAQKIITYREQNGLFRNIEEIQNVSGIGKATFEKMREKITI